MAAFPRVIMLLLVSITGEHAVFSGFLKAHDTSRWPKDPPGTIHVVVITESTPFPGLHFTSHNCSPPCEMYYPPNPLNGLFCPNVTAYVCTTLGHTYQNECHFCVARWEYGSHIKFDKYGKCADN